MQQGIGGGPAENLSRVFDYLHCGRRGSTHHVFVCIDDHGNLQMPTTPDELFSQLKKAGYETKTVHHPPLFTVADSQNLRGTIAGGHTKNLFLKDKKDNFFLVTLGEDRTVNLKELHKIIGGASRLSSGKPEKLMEYLGWNRER